MTDFMAWTAMWSGGASGVLVFVRSRPVVERDRSVRLHGTASPFWRAVLVIGYEKASISRNYFRGEARPLPRATARTSVPARNMKMLGRRGNGANPEGAISSLRRCARSLRP